MREVESREGRLIQQIGLGSIMILVGGDVDP